MSRRKTASQPRPGVHVINLANGETIDIELATPGEAMRSLARSLLYPAAKPATEANIASTLDDLTRHPGATRYAGAWDLFISLMAVVDDFGGLPEFDQAAAQAQADLDAAEAAFVATWGPLPRKHSAKRKAKALGVAPATA